MLVAPGFMLTCPFLYALLALILSARLVAAASKSVIIDDTHGDLATGALPVYSPSGNWTQGIPCTIDPSECPLVNPDPSKAQNGTWHDSVGTTDDTAPRTVDLVFEGSSISVYCIISEVDRVEIAVSNMTFELDGVHAGQFSRDVDGTMDAAGNYNIHYNVSVFNSGTLPQSNHTLRISSVGYSRMLFDYAEYTTNSNLGDTTSTSASLGNTSGSHTSQTSSAARPNIPKIIGGVIAGVVALVGLGVLVYMLIRRRRRRSAGSYAPHHIDRLKHDKRFYGKDDVDTRSFVSSADSVTLEAPSATSFLPYRDATRLNRSLSSTSRFHEDLERNSIAEPSPTDTVPLMDFPAPPSLGRHSLPRIVVTGEETRLVGPDNSMARYARQKVAEREAELTRRMREMEIALAAKYGVPAQPISPGTLPVSPGGTSSSAPSRADSIRSTGSGSEAVLRGQLEEMRVEITRMRLVQQQMVLELRDATEPPPEYQ